MPTRPVKKNGRVIGYRWGKHGKLYRTSKYGKEGSKSRANLQGRAIKASQYRRSFSSVPKRIVKKRRRDGYVQRYHIKFKPPKAAKKNAMQALLWKKKYPEEVKAMTRTGWVRARQLSSGKPISKDIVKRMAKFSRHRKNAKINPKFKSKPWKDRGYVAWQGWGGDEGIDWAKKQIEKIK
jgi:hypothetical protein